MKEPSSQRKRHAKPTRERILDAAMELFSAKGFHDTKLDEIVAEASTSKGSIYFHFPNKEKLCIALADELADLIGRRAQEAIAGEAEGIRRVQAALEAVLETFSKYRRPAKLLLVQAVGPELVANHVYMKQKETRPTRSLEGVSLVDFYVWFV